MLEAPFQTGSRRPLPGREAAAHPSRDHERGSDHRPGRRRAGSPVDLRGVPPQRGLRGLGGGRRPRGARPGRGRIARRSCSSTSGCPRSTGSRWSNSSGTTRRSGQHAGGHALEPGRLRHPAGRLLGGRRRLLGQGPLARASSAGGSSSFSPSPVPPATWRSRRGTGD